MKRATLRGSAASAACAFVTASVSGSERYSTPAGERYWTDWAPASVPFVGAVAHPGSDVRRLAAATAATATGRERMGVLQGTPTDAGCCNVHAGVSLARLQ